MRERDLMTYELDIIRCIYCGDCVEVCPHGALGETPNFELSTYQRFGVTVLAEEDLAAARPAALERVTLRFAPGFLARLAPSDR